jgi:hypothetical protein
MVDRFQSFWFGETISPYQRLAMKSFVDHDHEYVLYAYDKFDVPVGVELRDASEILPRSRVFFYGEGAGVGRGSVSAFSNLFRYHLLRERGHWWVDADVVCLADTVPSTDVFMGWEYDHQIGSAMLKFPARHPFVSALCDAADAVGPDPEWGTTGPHLVTSLAREKDLLHVASPHPFAYPVQSAEALHLFIPARRAEVQERLAGKPFLHMWNEVMRRAVILPCMAPPRGSVMADLFARHGIKVDGPAYTADQIQRLSDNYYAAATWSHPFAENAEITRLKELLLRAEMLRNSRSFRVTAPLRRIANLLRSLRPKRAS